MSRTNYFIYPRDIRGNRTGHTIAIIVREGKAFHGTSLCAPADQFDHSVGRSLALARAEEAYRKHLKRVNP